MNDEIDDSLERRVAMAAAGDRAAAEAVLGAVKDKVYRLALRMLGHPADAEDAAQEILVIVLTHLGSFRGESAFSTWVFRIAANHLARAKRGRREEMSFELLSERLGTGLQDPASIDPDPEAETLAREVRLRCTEAMLLSLDRELRMAYLLGDVFELSGEEAAAVLEVDPATYRKRLSRARTRLHDFMRGQCGLFDPSNACRCRGQVACMMQRGLLRREELLFANHPRGNTLRRATDEVDGLLRVAEVISAEYVAPASLGDRLRALLDPQRLELLRH